MPRRNVSKVDVLALTLEKPIWTIARHVCNCAHERKRRAPSTFTVALWCWRQSGLLNAIGRSAAIICAGKIPARYRRSTSTATKPACGRRSNSSAADAKFPTGFRPRSLWNCKDLGAGLGPVDAVRPDIGHQRREARRRPFARGRQFLLPRSDPGAQSKVDCEGTAAAGAPPRDSPDAPRNNVPSVLSLPLLDQGPAPYLNETRCSFSSHPQNAQLALRGCGFYGKKSCAGSCRVYHRYGLPASHQACP